MVNRRQNRLLVVAVASLVAAVGPLLVRLLVAALRGCTGPDAR